jgi:hypothetical protein
MRTNAYYARRCMERAGKSKAEQLRALRDAAARKLKPATDETETVIASADVPAAGLTDLLEQEERTSVAAERAYGRDS